MPVSPQSSSLVVNTPHFSFSQLALGKRKLENACVLGRLPLAWVIERLPLDVTPLPSNTSCHFTPHPIAHLTPVLNHLPTHFVQFRWLSMWDLARIGRLHTDQILRRKTPGKRTGKTCFCRLQSGADVFCSRRGEFSTAGRLSCGEFGEEIGQITCWFLLIYSIEIRNPSTGP